MKKHRASLHYEHAQPQIEQNPAPPPLGGGVSSFWGEKKRTRPCVAICGRSGDGVGKRHQQRGLPTLLKPCEPVVDESRGSGEKTNPSLQGGRDKAGGQKERQKKKKQARSGLQKATLRSTEYPRWRTEFSSTHRTGLERTVGGAHSPNIRQ